MGILVILSQVLEQQLDKEAMTKQEGDDITDPSKSTAKDHTNFLLLLAGYITALCVTFIIGFRTVYKRTLANEKESSEDEKESGDVEDVRNEEFEGKGNHM